MTAHLVLTALLSAATVFNSAFDKANAAYTQGDYNGAIVAYERLLGEAVWEAPVFVNLGNAYYQTGNIGAAIANYERALQVAPRFKPAIRNLEFAVQHTERQVARPLPPAWEQSVLFWHFGFSPRAVYWLAVVCWLAFWMTLAVRLWRPNKQLTRIAALLAFLSLAFATSSFVKSHPQLLAVSMLDHVPVRFGVGAGQSTSFELMKGDRVAIDKRRDGWAQVRTADGARGWTKESQLALVGPPYTKPISEPTPNNTAQDTK